MSKLNIQISSEDLEKIIYSDPTASLEIKNFIVQEFTRRHLKPLVNEDLLNKVKNDILKEIDNNLDVIVGKRVSGYASTRILNDAFVKRIKDMVNEAIKNLLTDMVKDGVEGFMSDRGYIDELVDSRIKLHFINILNSRFNDKLKTISDKIDELFKETNK